MNAHSSALAHQSSILGRVEEHADPTPDFCKAVEQWCQDSYSVHPKLVNKLKQFYLNTDSDKFFEDFILYLRYPVNGVTERSTYLDRTLEFVAKFACSFLEKDENSNDDIEVHL